MDLTSQPGPRLLAVPGLDGDPRLLMSVAPLLFPGLRVLPFDHVQDRVKGGVEGMAERAVRLLDVEGDAPSYVCGESFGGIVALAIARLFPERVRGLILLSTFGRYPSASTHSGRLGLLLWRVLGDQVARRILRAWRPLSAPGVLGLRCSREVLRAYVAQPALDLAAYRAKRELALKFDARPWLPSLTCPTFILNGTWDPVVPTRAGRELARLIPRSELHCLPGGHLVHIVRAADAGQRLARWIVQGAEMTTQGVAG